MRWSVLRHLWFVALAALAALPAQAAPARGFSFADWWLPPNHAEHGHSIDTIFLWIFWVTVVVGLAVQATLVAFLIRYRRRASASQAKAHHAHGNLRLEVVWTLVPAAILATFAFASRAAWNAFRYDPTPDAQRVQVLVVGQQFKWNVVNPGPDGKLGTYLRFPSTSDPKYRAMEQRKARSTVARLVATEAEFALGKAKTPRPDGVSAADWTDPGDDDSDVENSFGPLVVPVGHTVEVTLGSKDVIHSFFLPHFRVKLDAVPGMLGKVTFKPLAQSTRPVAVAEAVLDAPVWIDRDTPTAVGDRDSEYSPTRPRDFTLYDPGNRDELHRVVSQALAEAGDGAKPGLDAVMRRLDAAAPAVAPALGIRGLLEAEAAKAAADDAGLAAVLTAAAGKVGGVTSLEPLARLVENRIGKGAPAPQVEAERRRLAEDFARAGVAQVTTVEAFPIVCAELCGMGHSEMRGRLIVVSAREYDNFIHRNAPPEKRTGRRLERP